jgi:hypothetical protein
MDSVYIEDINMSMFNKIDDKYRLTSSVSVKIDYQWRDANIYTKINNEWKLIHKNKIAASDILGFKLIYRVNKNKTWDTIPRLKYNPKIPASLSISNSINMDFLEKGIVYQYRYEVDNYEEGILYYEANLYAVTYHGLLVNMSSDDTTPIEEGILSVHDTDRMDNMTLDITGHMFYNSNGFQINAWNSFFDINQFTDIIDIGSEGFDTRPEDNGVYKEDETNHQQFVNRIIFPIKKRSSTYSPFASVGIARNTMTAGYNMLASYGTLDHTITFMKLNGITKPFMIEIDN